MTVNKKSKLTSIVDYTGKVECISPVILLDPADPFALVVIIDEEAERAARATVVLKGSKVLSRRDEISPGRRIVLKGVARKAWPVQEMLSNSPCYRHLRDRVPSHVFVVSDPDSISWEERDFGAFTSSLPATQIPLASFQGRILDRGMMSFTTKKLTVVVLHWVEVEPDNPVNGMHARYLLFTTYFPMSSALQGKLMHDVTIRAVNVHLLYSSSRLLSKRAPSAFFGCCLRSTLVVMPERNRTACYGKPQKYPEKSALAYGDELEATNFYFAPFRRSYREYICQNLVESWARAHISSSLRGMPTVDDLAESALRVCRSGRESRTNERREGDHVAASRRRTRNPYAEFFDHNSGPGERSPNYIEGELDGCPISREHDGVQVWPCFVSLEELRSLGLAVFRDRLKALICESSPSLHTGWTGSIHMPASQIIDRLGEFDLFENFKEVPDRRDLFTGGFASSLDPGNLLLSIRDRYAEMQVGMRTNRSAVEAGAKTISFRSGEKFIFASICGMTISSLCFGTPSFFHNRHPRDQIDKAQSSDMQGEEVVLPPFEGQKCGTDSIKGGCSIFRLQGYLFMVSTRLVCVQVGMSEQNVDCQQVRSEKLPFVSSVTECLSSHDLPRPRAANRMSGVLLRQQYRFAKTDTSSGTCNSCNLIISELPSLDEPNFNLIVASQAQSMTLKLQVCASADRRIIFRQNFARLCSDSSASDDQIALGTSWWAIADSSQTSALVSGGWEELCDPSVKTSTYLTVECQSPVMHVASRGQVYAKCLSTEIRVTMHMDIREMGNDETNLSVPASFDYIGGKSILDGNLHRRPSRKIFPGFESERIVGELRSNPSAQSIPLYTILEIFMLLARNIGEAKRLHLPPSLTIQIRKALLINIAFCQARCTCSRCFRPLIRFSEPKNRFDDNENRPSFWHLPLGEHGTPDSRVERSLPSWIQDSGLGCPNGCLLEESTVSWECSGVIDDGTGQAKIYAERECALTLLRMNAEAVRNIEKFIWHTSDGTVQFHASIPAPFRLQKEVRDVLWRVRGSQDGQFNALNGLEAAQKALYLLQYHCRKHEPRSMTCIARCIVGQSSLGQSQVDHVGPASTSLSSPSYSLSVLQLHLVDCCVPFDD